MAFDQQGLPRVEAAAIGVDTRADTVIRLSVPYKELLAVAE